MSAQIVSVNIGQPEPKEWSVLGSAIAKHPVAGETVVGRLGLLGDQVADTRHHGGVDQAVYAFAREDLDHWVEQLGAPIRDGQFGENLTTSGLDVNEAEIGERWRIGSALFEVASVRIPCNNFKSWMGDSGFDNTGWVKRFTAAGRPGPYLRVIREGSLAAGAQIVVEHRPGHGVTVSTMFQALTTDRTLLPLLLRVDGLVDEARRTAEAYLDQHGA